MSVRSKKKQQSEVPHTSTPVSSSSHSQGRTRQPSPMTISRLQERDELASLNDRLAAYIDRVRFLEGENTRLSTIIRTQEESVTREGSKWKETYEAELEAVRRKLDETSQEKAKCLLDFQTASAELKELKDKVGGVRADLKDKERRLLGADSQVADLQARLSDAVNQRKHWETEYSKLKKEFDVQGTALENARRLVEQETLLRVEFENKNKTLNEKLIFLKELHDKELNETRIRSVVEVEEVDARYQDEFESRLKEEIQDMREENDRVVEAATEEAARIFEKQIEELQSMSNRSTGETETLRTELRNVRTRMDELSGENGRLVAQNASLEARVRDLVNQLRAQQEEHEAAISRKDGDIRALRTQLEELLAEFRDLKSVNIRLDNEIATYSRLLEAEETRLNISHSSTSTAASPFAQRSVRRTVTGRKRKRGEGDMGASFVSHAKAVWAQQASAAGPVEVYETDEAGRYVKLFNTRDEDVSLAGWKLQHKAGEEETVFKFHRTLTIKGKEYCTVWSSDTDTEHNPPSDIVMKGKRFFSGNHMKTTLHNADGEEQASREMTRSEVRTSFSGPGSDVDSAYEVGREALFYRQGEEEQSSKKECAIM